MANNPRTISVDDDEYQNAFGLWMLASGSGDTEAAARHKATMERLRNPKPAPKARRPSWLVLTLALAALIVAIVVLAGCGSSCDRSISKTDCCTASGPGKTSCEVGK